VKQVLTSWTLLLHSILLMSISSTPQVGDVAPLFDMMAATLEKLPVNSIKSRSAAQAVCVLAHCVAYVTDQSSAKQVGLIYIFCR
jgi:hypothetical protein